MEGTRAPALTTSGVYRWSRNPQYLGYLLTLTGAAVVRRSLTAMALTVAAGLVYVKWIPVEERQLATAHGEAYERYRAMTRRWWGTRPSCFRRRPRLPTRTPRIRILPMDEVDRFIDSLGPAWQRQACTRILEDVRDVACLGEHIKWGNPYFDHDGSAVTKRFCAKDWINVYFFR